MALQTRGTNEAALTCLVNSTIIVFLPRFAFSPLSNDPCTLKAFLLQKGLSLPHVVRVGLLHWRSCDLLPLGVAVKAPFGRVLVGCFFSAVLPGPPSMYQVRRDGPAASGPVLADRHPRTASEFQLYHQRCPRLFDPSTEPHVSSWDSALSPS